MKVQKVFTAILRNPIEHNKRIMELTNNQLKNKVNIHYNHLNKWIESTLNKQNVSYLDERIEMIRNEIKRFEMIYQEPEFKILGEQLHIKLKQMVRKVNFNATVRILTEHSFKANKLNFKKITGFNDYSFVNMYITHKITKRKNGSTKQTLVIDYIANDPMDTRKLIFDFPYNQYNNEMPDIETLNKIFTNVLNSFKIKIEYKPIDF